jgi:hypothetical protein
LAIKFGFGSCAQVTKTQKRWLHITLDLPGRVVVWRIKGNQNSGPSINCPKTAENLDKFGFNNIGASI